MAEEKNEQELLAELEANLEMTDEAVINAANEAAFAAQFLEVDDIDLDYDEQSIDVQLLANIGALQMKMEHLERQLVTAKEKLNAAKNTHKDYRRRMDYDTTPENARLCVLPTKRKKIQDCKFYQLHNTAEGRRYYVTASGRRTFLEEETAQVYRTSFVRSKGAKLYDGAEEIVRHPRDDSP